MTKIPILSHSQKIILECLPSFIMFDKRFRQVWIYEIYKILSCWKSGRVGYGNVGMSHVTPRKAAKIFSNSQSVPGHIFLGNILWMFSSIGQEKNEWP